MLIDNFVKYEPNNNYSGEDNFKYYLINQNQSYLEYHDVSLTINPLYDSPPLAVGMNVLGVEDISFIIDLSGRDQNQLIWDNSYFTFIAHTSPSYGFLTDVCNNNTVINL